MEITITFTEEELKAIRVSLAMSTRRLEKIGGEKTPRNSMMHKSYEKILDACINACVKAEEVKR